MKIKWMILMFLLLIWNILCVSLSAGNKAESYVQQIGLPIADPYILCYGGCYYAYGTNERGFAVYVSRDFMHWRRNPVLALSPENSWGNQGYWAPEVYYIQSLKKFYMFYTVNEQVCVATSDSPEGPFVQDMKKPLWGVEKNIDPSLFIDSDGKAYLYFFRFTGGNVIWCAELNADLKSLKEETLTKCVEAEEEWERRRAIVAEGPSLLKRGSTYYLLYSANHFESQDYAVGYAVSDSPYGPWQKYSGNPILRRGMRGTGKLVGIGHGAPFQCMDGKFRYVFHAHANKKNVQPRSSYIKELVWSDNGILTIGGDLICPVLEK